MLSLDGKHTISLVSYSCDTKDFRLSAQLFTSCIKLVDESIKDDRESFFFLANVRAWYRFPKCQVPGAS